MILGWVCSAETLAAAKVAQAYKIPMLSAASSAPAISKLWEWIWRFYSDINQAHLIADYLNDKWSKNIAVLYENTDYAVDFFQTLKPLYKWNILIDEKINSDERDLWIVAKKVAKQVESLDAVIFVNGW
jgi:ABC-type branched-subunit amino acid transport system substrate-binding protein